MSLLKNWRTLAAHNPDFAFGEVRDVLHALPRAAMLNLALGVTHVSCVRP